MSGYCGGIIEVFGFTTWLINQLQLNSNTAEKGKGVSASKAEEKAEAIVIPKEPDDPVIFPVDPNDFNPVGLVKVPRAGTTNGPLISWMDPLTNTEIFRWDKNTNRPNGPHYHIIHSPEHYYPGMIVPEPYATIYFPFR